MRDDWVETVLGEVALLNPSEPALSNTDHFAPMDAVHVGKRWLQYTEERNDRNGARARAGDVLFARITPCLENGKVAQVQPELDRCGGSTEFIVLRGTEKCTSDFLYFWCTLKANRDKAAELMTGTTGRQRLSWQDLGSLSLWLPPLPEQKRIVDLISSVDAYIEALQQQLDGAKRSRNAVLHDLLSAGGEDWVETTLGEVAQMNPEQAKDFDSERLIKYVDLSTVTYDNGIDSKIDPIPFNEAPGRARRLIRENDVIVATVRPYLKGFAFVSKDFNEQIASTGFCVIRAESELILPELVWALVGSDDFVDFLIRRSTGSSYPAVRPIDISEFNFMLPPFKDQEMVSQLIRTFDQLIKDSTNLINSTQNLRSGLLSDLLSGEHEIPVSYDNVVGAA